MMTFQQSKTLFMILAVTALTAAPGFAIPEIEEHPSLSSTLGQNETTVTLEQAVLSAVAAIPGRAVEAELSADEGRIVYEVEIIDQDQDRRRVYVDAKGGRVIKVRSDSVKREVRPPKPQAK
jgi:peptidase YpeB-like protein